MRVLVALGGNALLRRGEPAEAVARRGDVARAAEALAGVAAEHELVIAHGSDPRVGPLALQDESHRLLELALRNALPDRDLATVLSGVVVSADDPAFMTPSRPVGPLYSEGQARRLAAMRGWSTGPDGQGFRRLVPSPEPQAIVELRSLRTLIDAGVLVICAGGGGIPVTLDDGAMRGVEAVVDWALTASLLARRLDADVLAMLTDVDDLHLGRGPMGPKVEAARRFVEATGRRAAIGELTKAVEIVRGESGAQILPPSA